MCEASPPHRVCYPFIGDLIGGSYIGTRLLIEHVDRSRFEPVVVLHEEGQFATDLRSRGVPFEVLRLPGLVGAKPGAGNYILTISRTVFKILRFLHQHRISVVHTNESPIHETWALPTRLARIPHVWHQRGRVTQSRLETQMRKLASSYVCISNFVARQMPATMNNRSVVIDNPFQSVTDAGARDSARRQLVDELSLRPETRIVGFCGHLLEVKRPHVFVEAAAKIAADYPGPLAFVMMGQDQENQAEILQQQAHRLGISDALHFLGFRADGEFWLGGFDMMLAPAVGEGFGRAVVEAAFAGVPVVAANAGGHVETIVDGYTGLLVEPDNPHALAKGALRLLGDDVYAAGLAEKSRQSALRRFSVGSHARSIEAVYQEALGH